MGFNNAMGMALQQSLQKARQLQDTYSSPAARGADAPAARWAAFGGGPAPVAQPMPLPTPSPVADPVMDVSVEAPGMRNMRERVDIPMPVRQWESAQFPTNGTTAPDMASMLADKQRRVAAQYSNYVPPAGDDGRFYMQDPSRSDSGGPDQGVPSGWASELSRFRSQDTPAYQPPSGGEQFRTSRPMNESSGRVLPSKMSGWGSGGAQEASEQEMEPQRQVQQQRRMQSPSYYGQQSQRQPQQQQARWAPAARGDMGMGRQTPQPKRPQNNGMSMGRSSGGFMGGGQQRKAGW